MSRYAATSSNPPRVPTTAAELHAHADDLSSDDEQPKNTIGRVPLEWYKDEAHIGYDVSGARIARARGRKDGIDRFLAAQDDPLFKWTIYDEENDEEMVLSKRDVTLLRRLRDANFAHPEFEAYPDLLDISSSVLEPHSLHGGTEPKRRFLPSHWEAIRVNALVRAIRAGTYNAKRVPDADAPAPVYLMWAGEGDVAIGYEGGRDAFAPPPLPAPKLPPPGHAASYNPPPEYLMTDEERAAWDALPEAERPLKFVPVKYGSLRAVPAYSRGVRELFERCLDLYLCPRAEGKRDILDPEAMLPKLPDPAQLRPFPSALAFDCIGHVGRVRSVSIDPAGSRAVSGGDDGTVRVWDLATGRCERKWALGAPIAIVSWCPERDIHIIAAAVEDRLVFIYPGTVTTPAAAEATFAALCGVGGAADASASKKARDADADSLDSGGESEGGAGAGAGADEDATPGLRSAVWGASTAALTCSNDLLPRIDGGGFAHGVAITLTHVAPVRSVAWHRRGDYVAIATPAAPTGQVLVHQLTKRATQCPFGKSAGAVQAVLWHPTKPRLFIAGQRSIRIYDLVAQELVATLESGVQWISSLGIHPSGDHVLAGSYDARTVWFDTDLGATPYKTLRYHASGVRRAAFHAGTLPLMATASDDGTLHVFHARVFPDDFSQNPVIVPVKILRGHAIVDGLGVLDFAWHPRLPWIVSAGADGKVKVWHAMP